MYDPSGGTGQKCSPDAYPAYTSVSLQLVEVYSYGPNGLSVVFLATINRGDSSASSSSFTQLNQQLYSLDVHADNSASFTKTDDPVNYQGSQSGSPLGLVDRYGVWNWQDTWDLITLTDTT